MAHTGKIAPIDKQTFTIELVEPFGPVLEAIGSQRPPFMMPARIASTSPEEQIKESTEPRLHPARRDAKRLNRRQEGTSIR
jgi:hypothetical protein